MNNKFIVAFLIVLCTSSVLYAEHKGEKNSTHYLMAMYGKNQLYFDSINSHQNITIGYNPMPNRKGFGLNAWYLQDDYTSYYGFKESMIIIQPYTQLLHKSLALKLGMNVYILSEGEEPGLKGWIPAIEIQYGIMNNIHISASYRSEMFFGRLTANLHYMLNDKISEIMLGYTYDEYADENYNRLTYKIDYMIFKQFLLRVWGNANFAHKLYGTQVGIGIII